MTLQTPDVERIVREVLARLGQASADGGARGESAESEPPAEKPAPASPSTTDDSELVLDGRVVTLDDVTGRLEGIRRVVVSAKAVVTPAVRDELLRRRVTLQKQTLGNGQPSAATAAGSLRLVLIAAGKRFDPAPLVQALTEQSVGVESSSTDCLVAATDQLAEAIRGENTLGLLLSRHPAMAVCLANRHAGVRAVSAPDPPSAATATASVGANLLILDPWGLSAFQLKKTATEFCGSGVRPCPEALRERLA